jgi:hypothetical protein
MADIKKKRYEKPLDWVVPEDLLTQYANNMVIQHTETEFILSFFEYYPPILLGEAEDIVSKIEDMKSVKAKCVARIVVPLEKMPSIIDALQTNFNKFTEKSSQE